MIKYKVEDYGKETWTVVRIRCVIERITYQNPENGYSVLRASMNNSHDLVTVVGSFPDVSVGSVLQIEGEWKNDKKYGTQFRAERWEETMPATVYGIEKYLGSGLIKGIGPKYAKKIVSVFGKDTIEVIEDDIEKLLLVDGIGKKRVQMIKESWDRQREIKNIMLFLQGYDVSTAYASRIFKTYGEKSLDTVKENPYRLADDIWGIGFLTADRIASKLGYRSDAPTRLMSGLLYTLNRLADEGHVYAREDQLITEGIKLLESDEDHIRKALESLEESLRVIRDGDAVYLPAFFYSEKGIAERLGMIVRTPLQLSSGIRPDFDALERETGVEYDDMQKDAIVSCLTEKVMILTGGPGTGKTTVTLGMIKVLGRSGLKILLAAPTGRAAKRMSEACRMEAKTIHRLLEYRPQEGYQKNDKTPLKGDVLIVDEASMIDSVLMYALLKAVPDEMRLIFVGDIDQLPSVGAGNVLKDMISSSCFKVVSLKKIFRQARTSRIIMNAHRINRGIYPEINNQKGTDFYFIKEEDAESCALDIVDLVKRRLPGFSRVSPMDIEVLTPMQRGPVGAVRLNQMLQEALNPEGEFLTRAGKMFRTGDKVMQIRNDYEKEVFNGDIGIISAIDQGARELSVMFDERTVTYEQQELDELVLAYAVTIHKSQGSEYPVVVMPVMMSHFIMLERNLIYTGVTRAKKLMVIAGDTKALAYAIKNVKADVRNTKLEKRIREAIEARQ